VDRIHVTDVVFKKGMCIVMIHEQDLTSFVQRRRNRLIFSWLGLN